MKKYPVGTKLKDKHSNRVFVIVKKNGKFGFKGTNWDRTAFVNTWSDETEFFKRVSECFTVDKMGKQTLKQQVEDLTDELAAKNIEIDKIKKDSNDHVKQANESRVFDSRRYNENMTQMTKDRDVNRDRADNAERRCDRLSESVTALKNALRSASESLCYSVNAVKV